MTDFVDVVRGRRMTRAFSPTPLADGVLEDLIDLASRAPSAGKSQGFHVIALEGPQTSDFWDVALPHERRGTFAWPRLLDAPVVLLPLADASAYVDRYGEADKKATGLGRGAGAWPAPYWTIDSSMAVMTLLLAVESIGLGALFFGVFKGEEELRRALDIPDELDLLGAVAIGHRFEADDGVGGDVPSRRGRSAGRPRRSADDIIHRGRWRPG
jgi:nitroreductase